MLWRAAITRGLRRTAGGAALVVRWGLPSRRAVSRPRKGSVLCYLLFQVCRNCCGREQPADRIV
eukprot:scaffold222610_cov43-Prasinocladus_malaysianus.AAC.1